MANRFWANAGHYYAPHVMPVLADCNFIVDSANGNVLGIRSLKGVAVANVFMHTSATPGVGNASQLNPNPASGVILVQMADNYNRYIFGAAGFGSPVSGTPLTSTTQHTAYTITSLGTATTAQWVAAGLPIGVTPNVGASFIATATGTIGGSATVEVIKSTGAGIDHIEVMGDPNQTLAPIATPGVGATIISNCFYEGAVTAPADGTVIGLTFYMSNSSVAAGAAGG